MSHSQARSPHRDVSGKFVHDSDVKDELQVALTANGTSHEPHASYDHTPDLESERHLEGTTAGPDVHSAAPNCIITSGDEPILTGLGSRVRFRSRVRISAGLSRRWRRSDGLSSNASSISGSPSSSISAPLRTHYTGNNGWGPLGSRVKISALQAGPNSPCRDDDGDGGKGNPNGNGGDGNARRRRSRSSWTLLDDNDADEYTHLLTSRTRYSYVGRYDSHHDDGERGRERWWREQLVDEAFGKWPGRLLNHHWWWWHLEPILCCFCEPGEEE